MSHPNDAEDTFDAVAKHYEDEIQNAAGVSAGELAQEKAEAILDVLEPATPGEIPSLLDIGCGVGLIERHIKETEAHVTGIDVSKHSLEIAREHATSGTFKHYDGHQLPFPDGSFDAAVTICVLHHIPPQERAHFMSEMARVVRPGGLGIAIEHNPINPVTQLIVARCPFDKDAILLRASEMTRLFQTSGFADAHHHFTGFSPWRSRFIRSIERGIARVPLGAQYISIATRMP